MSHHDTDGATLAPQLEQLEQMLVAKRQLGLLWGGVATLLVIVSPMAGRLPTSLPACPIKSVTHLPCPTCGTTRAAVALSRLDLAAALTINPLAAVSWVLLVGGGLVAGLWVLTGRPIREPDWRLSVRARWFLVLVVVANWIYLIEAGT